MTARRSLLRRRPWLEVTREAVLLPNGHSVPDFYRVDLPDYVVIVPYTADGRVVALRSYRHGARRVALGLPSGFCEPREEALEAARRELREETGCAAERWIRLGSYTVDGNRGCGVAHIFAAHGVHQVDAVASGDLGEMEIVMLPLRALIDELPAGEIVELAMAAAVGLAALAAGGGSDGGGN